MNVYAAIDAQHEREEDEESERQTALDGLRGDYLAAGDLDDAVGSIPDGQAKLNAAWGRYAAGRNALALVASLGAIMSEGADLYAAAVYAKEKAEGADSMALTKAYRAGRVPPGFDD